MTTAQTTAVTPPPPAPRWGEGRGEGPPSHTPPPPDARCPIPDAPHTPGLLRPFLDGALGLLTLADLEGLTLHDLAQWADSPRARADLAAITELAEARARAIAAQARVAALTRLTELCVSTPDERELLTPAQRAAARETARKAAESLLKHTSPTPAHARKPTPESHDADARSGRRSDDARSDARSDARTGAAPHPGAHDRSNRPPDPPQTNACTETPPTPAATPGNRARGGARGWVAPEPPRRRGRQGPDDVLSFAQLRRRRQPAPGDPSERRDSVARPTVTIRRGE